MDARDVGGVGVGWSRVRWSGWGGEERGEGKGGFVEEGKRKK